MEIIAILPNRQTIEAVAKQYATMGIKNQSVTPHDMTPTYDLPTIL
jgi:hypothetical protein